MKINNTLQKAKENLCLRTFLWAVGLSFLFFIPWIIYNGGYFFFYGDFNVQQIPFYQMIHDSLRSGNIGWSYTTDLGANIIGSYSFYMIGSPFFWLTLLFPSEAVPFLIAPLLMIKFGFAAMFAYMFLRRYVNCQTYAMIGALLYAFSGFGIYNIFFNHFHEAMITFPMMLAAMDSFIYDRKKGYLGLSVFAASFVNYYFFAGQAVFIFMYWCFRMVSGSYKMKFKEFLRMALEIIVGFMCSGVVLVPSIFAVIQNSRLDNFPHGWNAVVYSSQQRYLLIVQSLFFPPDMPAYANFAPDSNAKWASVAAWLPLFSMVGVFSFYKLKTHKWLREFIPVLLVMAFVPAFNCLFQLLNFTYYARWFYMLTMMFVFATVVSLDREETDFKPGLIRTFVITALITFLVGLMPEKSLTDPKADHTLGLEKYADRFWAWVGVAFVGLVALTIVLALRSDKKLFRRTLCITLSVFIVGYSTLLLGVGVVNASYDYSYIKNQVMDYRGVFNKELEDITEVRSDYYDMMDNVGMYWQVPTIQAFQSIVPGSVMDFYTSIGVERSVGSRPETDVYGIRSLLSVKYLFDNKDGKQFRTGLGTNEMPGWKEILTKDNYTVYENRYFIPYGFTYDEYITEDEYEEVSEDDRHLLLLKAMVLSDEQARRHKDILKHHRNLMSYEYTQAEYFNDCRERNKLTCSSVDFENSRFTAKFTAGDSDELVFFSIPYEDGWSATVNGKPAQIEKVNVGFMAVRVPAGKTSEIVFTYQTPGLVVGGVVSVAGVLLFIAYLFICRIPARKKSYHLNYIEDDEGQAMALLDEELFELYEEDSPTNMTTVRHNIDDKPAPVPDNETGKDEEKTDGQETSSQ